MTGVRIPPNDPGENPVAEPESGDGGNRTHEKFLPIAASLVYFAASTPHQYGPRLSDPIKIGLAQKPERRLANVQPGNPNLLWLLETLPGGRLHEQLLHERFAEGRLRGEWFAGNTPGLQQFMSDINEFRHFGLPGDDGWPGDLGNESSKAIIAFYREANARLREQIRA